jgi:phosphoglycerate dehydrogenase-like enzyme
MSIVVIFLPQARVETARITLPETWKIRFLESASSTEEIIAACQDADCILSVGSTASITAQVLESSPNLKLIQCLGAGFNHVDLAAAKRLKIPVANSPGQNARTVAEFTIGTIITLQRRIIEADAEIKAGNYAEFRRNVLNRGLQELAGSRIGLIGFGNIGIQVAKIAVMLGAFVSYYTLHRKPTDIELQLGVEYKSFTSILKSSDIVSLHIPLNAETQGLIGSRELELMPAGSLLINTSRGEILDQLALAKALESGLLAAAIDTLSPEPPHPDHPLLNLSQLAQRRLLLTPHVAGVTLHSNQKMLVASIANIERVLRGEAPEHLVNLV